MAAQIDHDPGDVAEEGDGDGGTDEREQGLDHAQADHIVSALRAVTCREHTNTHRWSPCRLETDCVHFEHTRVHSNGDSPMMLPRAQTACSHTFW